MDSLSDLSRVFFEVIVRYYTKVNAEEATLDSAVLSSLLSLFDGPDDVMFTRLHEMIESLRGDPQHELCSYLFYGIRVLHPVIKIKAPLSSETLLFVESSIVQLVNHLRRLVCTPQNVKQRIAYKERESRRDEYLELSGLQNPSYLSIAGLSRLISGRDDHFENMRAVLIDTVLKKFSLPTADSDEAFAFAVKGLVHAHQNKWLQHQNDWLQQRERVQMWTLSRHSRPRSASASASASISGALLRGGAVFCPRFFVPGALPIGLRAFIGAELRLNSRIGLPGFGDSRSEPSESKGSHQVASMSRPGFFRLRASSEPQQVKGRLYNDERLNDRRVNDQKVLEGKADGSVTMPRSSLE